MRSKVSLDGKRRILAKVAVELGVDEITTYALANPQFRGRDDALNEFEGLNKRQLFNVAKETIAFQGVDLEIAHRQAEENWSTRQMQRAKEHVVTLFPEVD